MVAPESDRNRLVRPHQYRNSSDYSFTGLTGKNIIGSELSGKGQVFWAENPSTKETLLPDFFEAGKSEISAAIYSATEAFQTYKSKNGNEKARFLEAICDEILALGDTLIKRCIDETGLPQTILNAEHARTIWQLEQYANLVREGSWVDARIDTSETEPNLTQPDLRSMLKPIGPIAIFGASNYPLAFSVVGGDTASAFAAGCTVVTQAHPAHPGTCELLGNAVVRAANKTGMPPGIFSMLHGRSSETGQTIVKDPRIKAVAFAGSFNDHKTFFGDADIRGERVPLSAEIANANPVFILPGALKERKGQLAKDLAISVTRGVGQFSTSPGLLFIQESSNQRKFRSQLFRIISETPAGVMLTKDLSNNFYKSLEKLKKIQGVKVAAMGKHTGNGYRGIAMILETNAGIFLNHLALQEQIFGPSAILVNASDKKELLASAGMLSGHLTATVHGTKKDLADYADLIAILEQKAGRIIINEYPTGVEVYPSLAHERPSPTATTDSRVSSVGTRAIQRFVRPVCYQNFPQWLLPDELRDANPLGIWRMLNGSWSRT